MRTRFIKPIHLACASLFALASAGPTKANPYPPKALSHLEASELAQRETHSPQLSEISSGSSELADMGAAALVAMLCVGLAIALGNASDSGSD